LSKHGVEAEGEISRSEMQDLANNLAAYLELFEDVFVIPDSIRGSEKTIKEAIRTTRKLIKKLRSGDRSVFKDYENWHTLKR